MAATSVRAIVLAAGRSSRFKGRVPKQLFPLCGRPLILYPLQVLSNMNLPVTMVVGYKADEIIALIKEQSFLQPTFVYQEVPLGTGDAVKKTQPYWDTDHILILNGDMPLIDKELINAVIEHHTTTRADITFVATYAFDPTGYGRVIQEKGMISIIEHKECSEQQLSIDYVNAGVYLIKRQFLEAYLSTLSHHESSGEFYLPDLIQQACEREGRVEIVNAPYDGVRGINTLYEFWEVEQIKRHTIIKEHMLNGVYFQMPQTSHVDVDVVIGEGTSIGAGVQLFKGATIGKRCDIHPYAVIAHSIIGDDSVVYSHTVISDSSVAQQVQVGPFARLRDNVTLDSKAVIGNFVEIKNSVIGASSKAKHLAYLGDATLEQSVNIGAGTITCNHNGVKKQKTYISKGAYIGSNTTLVAPLTIGSDAFTAAGSVVTQDVEAGALAIGRTRQVNKVGYAHKLRERLRQEATPSSENISTVALTKPAVVAHEDSV
jgi:bifunctional UDP-N-acetylglucosamine pyrophosphorylase / glucosamine-1-phosphate N-acetyltransferase